MAEKRLFPDEAVTAGVEPGEVLIADPRGGMSPSQMVDLKLLALLRFGNAAQRVIQRPAPVVVKQSGDPSHQTQRRSR
jgi:hypothetical protein